MPDYITAAEWLAKYGSPNNTNTNTNTANDEGGSHA